MNAVELDALVSKLRAEAEDAKAAAADAIEGNLPAAAYAAFMGIYRTDVAAADALAELRAELRMAQKSLQDCRDHKDGLRPDAERYRWLKERYGRANFTDSGMAFLVDHYGSIDAAVDAALAKPESQAL